MTTAVLVIDMIKDFVTGKFENERAQAIVPNIKRLLEAARSSDKPVVYIHDSHPPGDHEFDIWGQHAVSGSEGSEFISELEPKEGEPVLEKKKYSAFYETDLDSVLKDLRVDEVVLTGVLTHICVQHTAADAFFRGYDVTVPRGCVEDLSDEENQRSLEFVKDNYGAEVLGLEDLLESW